MKATFKSWFVLAALVFAAVVAAMATLIARAAGVWYVAPGGKDSKSCSSPKTACATIRGALSKPGFAAGDTLRVASGTYTGSGDEVILLDKDVILSGGWNTAFTAQDGMSIVDGQRARRGITINNGVTVSIERFT